MFGVNQREELDLTFTVEVVGCRDDYALSRPLAGRQWVVRRQKAAEHGGFKGLCGDSEAFQGS